MASTLRFPEDISGSGSYMVLTRYNSQGFTTAELRTVDQVFIKASPIASYGMPIPNELTDSSSVSYEDIQDTNIAGKIQNAATAKMGSAAQMANLATGSTNPNISTMLFNGVQAKAFSFSWSLVPETKSEANSISEIIQGLEEAKLPYFAVAGQRLKFPDIFRISFAGVRPKLLKYMPSVITGVEANYANGHFQVYSDGNIPYIQLTVSFVEIVSRTREMQKRLYGR